MLSKNRDIASRSSESSAPGFASSFSGQLVWSHMVDPSVLSTKDKVQLSGLSVLHVGLIGVLIDEVLMPPNGSPGMPSQWYGAVSRNPRTGIVRRGGICVHPDTSQTGVSNTQIS